MRPVDPQACHVCGGAEADHDPSPRSAGHEFWSNADALAEADAHDRRVRAAGGPVYSSGARNAEAAYVAQHRPY